MKLDLLEEPGHDWEFAGLVEGRADAVHPRRWKCKRCNYATIQDDKPDRDELFSTSMFGSLLTCEELIASSVMES